MRNPAALGTMSPLEAYRSDIADGAHTGAPSMSAAVLLWQARGLPRAKARKFLTAAAAEAIKQYGEERIRRGCSYDRRPSRSAIGALRVAAQETEHAGYLAVAAVILDGLAEFCADGSDMQTTLLLDRARNARKRGRLDLADGRAQLALRLAREKDNPDLTAYAYGELAAIAGGRGNYPAIAKFAARGLSYARRARNRRLEASCHNSLGTRDGNVGNFESAVAHFGAAYARSRPGEMQFFTAIGNLAHVALLAGYPAYALNIARHGLTGPVPLLVAIGLVGTVAVAAAEVADAPTVDWAAAEARRLSSHNRHPREVALALTECWEALTKVGRLRSASIAHREAEKLANEFGFGEIQHRLTVRVGRPLEVSKPTRLSNSRVSILSQFGDEATEVTGVLVTL
jgi:hypothetical protein